MTAQETLRLIRLVLDDGRLSFYGVQAVCDAVADAQDTFVRANIAMSAIMGGDHALRPLYAVSDMAYGDTLPDNTLHVQGVHILRNNVETAAVPAHLVSYPEFLNAEELYADDATESAVYAVAERKLYFARYRPTDRARVWRIRAPQRFSTTQALEVPAEYHAQIALQAADRLSALDKGESRRKGIAGMSTVQMQQREP